MGTRIQTGYDDVDEFMDAVPRGEYLARLIDVEEDESSSGNPMLVWDFELLEDYPGSTVRGWTSLQEHALSDARKYFRAIGKNWKSGDDLEKLAKKAIRKAKVRVVVSIRKTRDRESGEERENNNIIGIYPAGTVSKKKGKNSAVNNDDDIPI